MMRLLLRTIAACLSAYAFAWIILEQLNVSESVQAIAFVFWLATWTVLELLALWRKKKPFPLLLTHLRYAPMAVIAFFLISVTSFYQSMILHSKWKIRQYVYSNASPASPPSLELHNDHRGWCGNGYSAAIYALYADTAAEGFESTDPAVRARSLQASIEVYDWLNGVDDGPFPRLIERASSDPDPTIRKIAAGFRGEAYGFEK